MIWWLHSQKIDKKPVDHQEAGTALPVIQTLGVWVTQYLAFSEPCLFWSGGCDCNPSLQLVWVRGTGRESGSDSGARSLLPKPKFMAA